MSKLGLSRALAMLERRLSYHNHNHKEPIGSISRPRDNNSIGVSYSEGMGVQS